jgi:hypothetical protein
MWDIMVSQTDHVTLARDHLKERDHLVNIAVDRMIILDLEVALPDILDWIRVTQTRGLDLLLQTRQ